MGLIHVTVQLKKNVEIQEGYEADFLVDTGATDSMAPGNIFSHSILRGHLGSHFCPLS